MSHPLSGGCAFLVGIESARLNSLVVRRFPCRTAPSLAAVYEVHMYALSSVLEACERSSHNEWLSTTSSRTLVPTGCFSTAASRYTTSHTYVHAYIHTILHTYLLVTACPRQHLENLSSVRLGRSNDEAVEHLYTYFMIIYRKQIKGCVRSAHTAVGWTVTGCRHAKHLHLHTKNRPQKLERETNAEICLFFTPGIFFLR